MIFHLIPHTHWDREWYLPEAGFRARLIPVLDDLLEQLERDPEARFVLDGQTVLLEDYLTVRPDAEAWLAAAVRRGALEIGPWYVLSDLLIPSGESLIRNLAEGGRDAARLGRRMDVLYSPDAFGHPAALPLLAAEFGIRHAVVRRGLGRPGGRDRDLYLWGGMLTHHLPREGYETGQALTQPGGGLAERWAKVRDEAMGRAVGRCVAVFVGADHHAAPADLRGLRRRLRRVERQGEIRISGLSAYFEDLEAARVGAPSIAGELRRGDGHTWVLQGVHGTRARLKRAHSTAEHELLRVTEPLLALAQWRGGRDRRPLLRHTWRTLLRCQFHDTLGGCCADSVARAQAVRLDGVRAASHQLALGALHGLAGHDPDTAREARGPTVQRLLLWNPCPRRRAGIVTAELSLFRRDILVGPPGDRTPRERPPSGTPSLAAPNGRPIPLQVLARRAGQDRVDATRHDPDQDEVEKVWVAFRAPALGGLGIGALGLGSEESGFGTRDSGLEVSEASIGNRVVSLRVSPTGVLTLLDRRNGELYRGLCAVEDEPDRGDTYTWSRGAGRPVRRGRPLGRWVAARGPLIGALETRWTMRSAAKGNLEFRLLTVLHADSPIVRLRLDVENHATDHRLRLRFPVEAGRTATAGAAFGVERRPPVGPAGQGQALERPARTAPAHQFVAAAGGSRGLAVLAPGFFEYEWDEARTISVTLLRSVGELSRADLPERPGHAGWPMPTPLAQETGSHPVRLALCPVDASCLARPDRLAALWEDAFLPIQTRWIRAALPAALSPDLGVELQGEGLVCTAVKPAESGPGMVLRCWNATRGVVEGRWRFGRALVSAYLVHADEAVLVELPLRGRRRSVPVRVEPGAISTIWVR